MKKTMLLIACIWMMLASCVEEGHSNDPPKTETLQFLPFENTSHMDTITVHLGECEYWLIKDDHADNRTYCGFTHKGDCPNPIHYVNK